ncbi:glycosyltransferase family 47 protein [Patescibacteria group bacterium]|nr:glycosyltransferase family 47 protein [Patescibacteria group bacterium]
MIYVPDEFKPIINTVYPPNNVYEFERWFGDNYKENLEREYLGVYWCAYQVNNSYGQNKEAMYRLQQFIDNLPNDKKYFTISQYDDSVGVDFKGLDVLEFNMSKNSGVTMPLMCQPHTYFFSEEKKYLANFIGSKTHPIRDNAYSLINNNDYYISFEHHNIEDYCRIISQSIFTLAFRGYGSNSFRVTESLQYGSIPVVITDDFINPFFLDFNDFGVLIKSNEAHKIEEILNNIPTSEIYKKLSNINSVYKKYYTYEGAYKEILRILGKKE